MQIWKWTLHLLTHSLAPSTVLCGPWPLELQTPTLLYLITAFSALFSPHLCLPKILFNIFQLSQSWSSHSYPSFRFTLKYLLNYTVTTCNIHSNFSFVIYPTISKWYRDLTWVKKEYIYIHISYLQTSRKLMLQLRGRSVYCSHSVGIPTKLVRLMCPNETSSTVRVGKQPPDMFPTKNGLKQGDALLPLLFKFALEYVVEGFR